MSRTIICDNHKGSKMTFGQDEFSPFILANVTGIYLSENNVTVSDNTMTDGGTFQGSVKKKRNIVLTLLDGPNNVYNQFHRDSLYVLFTENTKGTLTYIEDGVSRTIDYYVEKVYKASLKKHTITVSLICPDPYFYDEYGTTRQMANWVGDFEFPHEFHEEGEELGHKSEVKMITIINDTATDNIGMTITIEAGAEVTNPKITRVEDDSHIYIGSDSYPFVMTSGDKLIITTGQNNKHVHLIHNGVKTSVNEYLTEDSTFIQIMRGANNIGYGADVGDGYMSVTIQYRMKYSGA